MADLKAYTTTYQFPYPLPGDSVQNTYARIQELAERIEATYTTLGINLNSATALLQVGDAAGGDLAGSTYPNPIIKNDAITTAKILNRQVTGNKIDEETITEINIADDAVTTAKLAVVDLKDGTTAVTQAQSDGSTKVATTAYVDSYIAGTVPDGSIGTSELADGAVTNAKVNASAAIAYSKLNLAGSIVNADVATGAAIAYSKLALNNSILESDLAFNIATQTELDNHTNATTSVHGISNTANLVYTNDSRLTDSRNPTGSAGGVLSGTYPNPGFAVDMATQSELDNHASDTTSVHGIADTSVLATQTDVSSAVSTHSSDTTSIHGISDTANLVYTNDSRLTDSRTPTGSAGGVLSGSYPNPGFAVDMATQTELDNHASDTTSVHGIADTSVLATATDVSTAVSTHSSDTTSVHGISNTADLVLTGDARLSDARTPTSHAGTHVPGGSDAIDLTKIIAVGATLPTLPDPLYPAGALFGVGTIAPYLLYRSTGSAWDQIGGAGGSSVTTSDTAPTTPSDGDLWYKTSNAKTYVWYEDGSSDQWVEVGAASQLAIPQHGSSHVRGGADVIDGDRLTVDYVPTRYTRNSAASGAGDTTDLTAHLSGLNNSLGLIYITNTAFTGSSAVNLTSLLLNTYTGFRLILDVTNTASSNIDIYTQLTNSGTPLTTNSYWYTGIQAYNSFTGSVGSNGNTAWFWGQVSQNNYSLIVVDLFGLSQSRNTVFTLQNAHVQAGNTIDSRTSYGTNNSAVAYDGLKIFPASGALTGTVRVYGYV